MALLLKEADVKGLMTMQDAVAWVEEALRHHGEARARNLPRQRVKLPDGTLHLLPGAELELGVVGFKSYTTFREGARFLVVLFSAENGRLLALMEADYLGMMRTGATSGVATRHMARPEADRLGLIGTGWQARGQLQAVAAVKKLQQVRVYSRDPERRRTFAREMEPLVGAEVVPALSMEEALEAADIVTTVSTSAVPLFPASAIRPGTHINAVGSNSLLRRELDELLVKRAGVVAVDSRIQARTEGGDLLIPAERGWIDLELLPELSEVVAGHAPGRHSAEEVTIFESHGLGLEDVAVAAHLYRRARESGVGEEVKLLDF